MEMEANFLEEEETARKDLQRGQKWRRWEFDWKKEEVMVLGRERKAIAEPQISFPRLY